MKATTKYCLALILASVIITPVLANHKTITLSNEGTLAATLGSQAREIDSITVAGPLNDTDFHTLWDGAFYGKLKYIDLSKVKLENDILPDKAFYGGATEQATKILRIDEIILPETLVEIGAAAFQYSSVSKIKFPPTLKRLGRGAFATSELGKSYNKRDTLIIPEGIESIPEMCFHNAVNCNLLILPSTLKRIESSSFNYALAYNVEFPSSLEYIGDNAFYHSGFLSLELPENLVEIGKQSFNYCDVEEVIFKDKCRKIGDMAFNQCFTLERLQLPTDLEEVPYGMTTLCKVQEVEIPASVKIIRDCTFGAVDQLPTLRRVVMHEGLEEIETSFRLRTDHKPIILPSTVRKVKCALIGASSVYCLPTTPPEVTDVRHQDFTIYVKRGCKALYEQAPGWRDAKEIIEIDDEDFELAAIGEPVSDSSSPEISVSVNGGSICIQSVSGSPILYTIYGIDGKVIGSGIAAPTVNISVLPGIYVVKAGTSTLKIAV